MYKLSEDISKSEFFYEFTINSVFSTYHVIEAKKRQILIMIFVIPDGAPYF
jgi:hypothetical protein